MIHIEAEGSDIIVIGRRPDGTRYQERKTFQPYFYVPSETPTQLKSINGEFVEKITCKHPADVRKLRGNYSKTWEADILYVLRYCIDNYDVMEKEIIRICFLDLEIVSEGAFPDVTKALKPITSIGIYDSFLCKYFVFAWKEGQEEKKFVEGDRTYFTFDTEEKAIWKFVSYVLQNQPDIFVAYNGDAFDFPYLFARLNLLNTGGLGAKILSPLREMDEYKDKLRLRGRETFDLYWGYRKLSPGEKESRSLDYTAFSEGLGVTKVKYEGTLDEFRARDLKGYMDYNLTDVEIMVKLDEKFGIISFHDELRRLSKGTWYSGFNANRMVDNYCLDYAKGKFVLPTATKSDKKHEVYKGATVIEPKKGLHDYVVSTDMKSLYPSIVLSCNLCPSTIDENGEIKTITGLRTKKSPKGMIPSILEKLFAERAKTRDEMHEYEIGTQEYDRLDKKQYAQKVLMNSIYGSLGNEYFRLYNRRIAETITAMGREALLHVKKELENNDCEVIAGDTDSCFYRFLGAESAQSPTQIADKSSKTVALVNKSFGAFAKKWGLEKHSLELQFERIYKTMFFLEDTKKRYAGLVCWEDGKEVDYVKIVGFEAKRSDTPYIARKFQKEFFGKILRKESKEEIVAFVKKFYNDILAGKFAAEQVRLPKGISKALEEYGGTNIRGNKAGLSIHIRAALYSNKFNGTNFKAGDKVGMVYVTKTPPNQPRTELIGIEEIMPPGYAVDWEKHAEKLCIDKVKNIFAGLGWNVNEVKGQGSLSGW